LSNKTGHVLAIVLVGQAVAFYTASRGEVTPVATPLAAFPIVFDNWTLAQEGVVDQETKDVLKADDLLTREYTDNATHNRASLFIAYFKTQRVGQSPHSPKNCLPGSGWQQESSGRLNLAVGSRNIEINRYLVSKGNYLSLVLYWYQSQGRVIAGEFAAKYYLVEDSIRRHRSDTALVRVVVPFTSGQENAAEVVGENFVKSVFPVTESFLPN
jgi:EpsI family protein